MRFRKTHHAVYRTQYHIVWIPRYRRKILINGVKQYLEQTISHLEGLDDDIEVITVNVQIDHVHLVIVIPPRIAVAEVIQFIKSQTTKKLKVNFPFMKVTRNKTDSIWSRGYCVSTIGYNEQQIIRYVENQEKEDKGQLTFDLGS